MSEKQFSTEETTLPPPNLTSSSKQTSTGKKIGLGLLSLLALWTVLTHILRDTPTEGSVPYDGYLGGIADKGLRYALGPKDPKHKHDHKHHSQRPHKLITPKAAEEMFLQIPNNSSARE